MGQGYGGEIISPRYSGHYTVLPSKGERFAAAAANIANFINSYAEHKEKVRRRTMEEEQGTLKNLMDAVNAGLANPDEVMVQGTPGGGLLEKYAGFKPPAAPVRTMEYTGEEYSGEGAPEEALLSPPGVEKVTGGYRPEMGGAPLKQYLARELLAGRGDKIPPHLLSMGGVKDPFGAEKAQARLYQLITENALKDRALGIKQQEADTKKDLAATQRFKVESIGAFKNRELDVKAKYYTDLTEYRKGKLLAEEAKGKSQFFGKIFTSVMREFNGDATLAYDIATQVSEGKPLSEFVTDDIAKRIKHVVDREDFDSQTKRMSAQSAAAYRTGRLEVDEKEFNRKIDQFNGLYQFLADKETNNFNLRMRANTLSVIGKKLSHRDTFQDGVEDLNKLVIDMGGTIDSPSGFAAALAWISKTTGATLFQPATTTTPPAPAQVPPKPLTPPKIAPRGSAPAAPQGGKPRTADDFLNKWRGKK